MDTRIEWYPGHMAAARRRLKEIARQVDLVLEVADARAPNATRNPSLPELMPGKMCRLVLSRADLADAEITADWLRTLGGEAWALDLRAASERQLRRLVRGVARGRRVAVLGVPNVGKSTLINRLAGRRGAPVGKKAGVTRGVQWLRTRAGVELLDSPGLLWPDLGKSARTGLILAWLGCIGGRAFDAERAAVELARFLKAEAPGVYDERIGMDADGLQVLERIGRRAGLLQAGGRVDLQKAAERLLNDFRAGRWGRISLESPHSDKLLSLD